MNIKKTLIYSTLALQLLVVTTPTPVIAQSIDSRTLTAEESITPMVDGIGWQYKITDGVIYRRLFNYSTNTPLSDWEVAP